MGVVYKAEDTKLRRLVALKFVPSDLAASEANKPRFVREAQAAASFNHPNICTIHEIDEVDGQSFIARRRSLRDVHRPVALQRHLRPRDGPFDSERKPQSARRNASGSAHHGNAANREQVPGEAGGAPLSTGGRPAGGPEPTDERHGVEGDAGRGRCAPRRLQVRRAFLGQAWPPALRADAPRRHRLFRLPGTGREPCSLSPCGRGLPE